MLLPILVACHLAPSATIGDLTVTELTLDGARADLAVEVANPWPVGGQVDAAWAFEVNQRIVASGRNSGLAIDPRESTTVHVPIAWRWSDLWAAAGAVGRAVPYRAGVTLSGENALGSWTVPLMLEGTLPALSIPDLDLREISVDEVSPSRVAWTLVFGVSGDLPVTDLAWVVAAGGVPVASGGLAVASGEARVPLAIELGSVPQAAWNALSTGVSVDVSGGVATPLGRLPLHWSLAWTW